MTELFLSTLSLRRATWIWLTPCSRTEISIHALLAESDRLYRPARPLQGISIHALLAESDVHYDHDDVMRLIFLSTLSLRRATIFCSTSVKVCPYFYPRSPCGERRIGLVFLWWGVRISIHALLAESDNGHETTPNRVGYFYPRSPCGERP